MKLFDPKAYHLHTQRAKKTFHNHNFLFEHGGNELVSRLQDLNKSFTRMLNLSPHPLPCLHQREEEKSYENDVFLRNNSSLLDSCFCRNDDGVEREGEEKNSSTLPNSHRRVIPTPPIVIPAKAGTQDKQCISKKCSSFLNFNSLKDHLSLEEKLPYPEASFDLILSCLQAHWVNHLPGLLKSIHTSLEEEGLFLGALWGGQTLFELRESLLQAELQLTGGASPRMAPLLHPADAPQLLSRTGFFSPVVDTETITVTYPTLFTLLKDLRGMGETNKLHDRKKTFTSRLLFEKAEEVYSNTFGNPDHTLPATFEIIYLTGWKA